MLTTVDNKTIVVLTVDIILAPDERFTVIATRATFLAASLKAVANHPTGQQRWALTVHVSGEGCTSSATMRGLPKPVREHLSKTLWDAGVEQWMESV